MEPSMPTCMVELHESKRSRMVLCLLLLILSVADYIAHPAVLRELLASIHHLLLTTTLNEGGSTVAHKLLFGISSAPSEETKEPTSDQ